MNDLDKRIEELRGQLQPEYLAIALEGALSLLVEQRSKEAEK